MSLYLFEAADVCQGAVPLASRRRTVEQSYFSLLSDVRPSSAVHFLSRARVGVALGWKRTYFMVDVLVWITESFFNLDKTPWKKLTPSPQIPSFGVEACSGVCLLAPPIFIVVA